MKLLTLCSECGPLEHQPIPEDVQHCACDRLGACACPCHNPSTFPDVGEGAMP